MNNIIFSSIAQFRGHGNSFHGKGGRGNKMAQLRYSLRLLLSMCSTKDNSILQDLHEQGIIPVLIGKGNRHHFNSIIVNTLVLLKTLQKRSNSDNNQILLEIQSDALLILSCLCENNHHRKVSATCISVHPSVHSFRSYLEDMRVSL